MIQINAAKQDLDNWISKFIVNEHWFEWALTDIVTPHNVYKDKSATNCILKFVEKIIDYKCMKNARARMITKVCKKWVQSQTRPYRKLKQYPRESVLKLLRLILKTQQDHQLFIDCDGISSITEWINSFIFTDILKMKKKK